MIEVTILDKLKSNNCSYHPELVEHIERNYKDSIFSIGQDAIKADLDRKEEKFMAAALRMVGVVNKAVFNNKKEFYGIDEDGLHATALKLFRDVVNDQRNSFGAETDRGFQDLYPVTEPYWI